MVLCKGDHFGKYRWAKKDLHEIGGDGVITVPEGHLEDFRGNLLIVRMYFGFCMGLGRKLYR